MPTGCGCGASVRLVLAELDLLRRGEGRATARAEGFREGLERAAKECEVIRDSYEGADSGDAEYDEGGAMSGQRCVNAIRALAPVPDPHECACQGEQGLICDREHAPATGATLPPTEYAGRVVAVDWEPHETRITVLVPKPLRVWLNGPATIGGEALAPISAAEVGEFTSHRRATEAARGTPREGR